MVETLRFPDPTLQGITDAASLPLGSCGVDPQSPKKLLFRHISIGIKKQIVPLHATTSGVHSEQHAT
jgi:hypothetical protein